MFDQLLLLAEAGHEASEGVPPAFIGLGALITLLLLLGVTFLTSGQHQRGDEDDAGHPDH